MDYYIKNEELMESFIQNGHSYTAYIVYSRDSDCPIIMYYIDGELDCIRVLNYSF